MGSDIENATPDMAGAIQLANLMGSLMREYRRSLVQEGAYTSAEAMELCKAFQVQIFGTLSTVVLGDRMTSFGAQLRDAIKLQKPGGNAK